MNMTKDVQPARARHPALKPFWGVFLVALALALCIPMLINRGPVIYFDTISHLLQGSHLIVQPMDKMRAHATIAPPAGKPAIFKSERSPFYSAFMILPLGRGGVHLVAALQALWIAVTISLFLVARRTAARDAVAIGAAVLVLSPVAFFSNIVIPDVFAGIVCLSSGALICHGARMGWMQRLMWAANLCAAVAMHQAYGVVAIATVGVVLLVRRRWGLARDGIWLALAAALAGTLLLLAANTALLGVKKGADTTAPFLLGRLMGDGTAERVLATDCARERWVTCRYLAVAPLSENDFLWGGGIDTERAYRGYNQLPPAQQIAIKHEARTIVARTLTRYWYAQVPVTLGNVARQFVDVDLGEFRQTDKLVKIVREYGAMLHADWVPHTLIRQSPAVLTALSAWFSVIYWLALAACALLAVGRAAARSGMAQDFAFVLLCLLFLAFNAALCGAAAGVFGRYEARFAWPFIMAMVITVRPVVAGGFPARRAVDSAWRNHRPGCLTGVLLGGGAGLSGRRRIIDPFGRSPLAAWRIGMASGPAPDAATAPVRLRWAPLA